MEAHFAGAQGQETEAELLRAILSELAKHNKRQDEAFTDIHRELREIKVRLNDLAR